MFLQVHQHAHLHSFDHNTCTHHNDCGTLTHFLLSPIQWICSWQLLHPSQPCNITRAC
jgi:hypothetical protein